MKIAVPVAGNMLCMHFGQFDVFSIFDTEGNSITKKEDLVPPPHEPGLLPAWLAEKKVDSIIAGGMGQRAQALFQQSGIKVVTGAPAEKPETVVKSYLENRLVTGGNACDH